MQRKLKPRQRRAAHMLALGHTATHIAQALGLCRETLWRWRQIPEFQKEIERFIEEQRRHVRHKLAHLSDAAVTTIWDTMHQSHEGDRRLQAALGVLKIVGISSVAASGGAKQDPVSSETPQQN